MTQSPPPSLIGRVRVARVAQFVFGTRQLAGAVPHFGSLVKTTLSALGVTVYGLIYDIAVNRDDAGTTRLLSVAENVAAEDIAWERDRLIPLDVSVLCVGTRDAAGALRQVLPPQPPIALDHIEVCESAEVQAFHARLDYFRLILGARDVPADELLAASIRNALPENPGEARSFTLRCARELSRLLADDSARLEQILRRLQ